MLLKSCSVRVFRAEAPSGMAAVHPGAVCSSQTQEPPQHRGHLNTPGLLDLCWEPKEPSPSVRGQLHDPPAGTRTSQGHFRVVPGGGQRIHEPPPHHPSGPVTCMKWCSRSLGMVPGPCTQPQSLCASLCCVQLCYLEEDFSLSSILSSALSRFGKPPQSL